MTTNENKMPKTFIPGWSNESLIRQLEYQQLGKTDMMVSKLTLGCAAVSKEVVFNDDQTEIISGADNVVKAIQNVIKSGINYIDTAAFYGCGKSEIVLGKALAGVPREAYYLATKVARKADCTFDFSAKSVQQSVELSLKKMGVKYIDVIQVI